MPHLNCEACGRDFYVRPYRARSAKCCSWKCLSMSKRGSTSANCLECGEIKSNSDFYVDNCKARGRVARCITCYKKRAKIARLGPRKRYQESKDNALRRGMEWAISFEQYEKWIYHAPCFYCGEEKCTGMDRLNNEQRYDINTVVACCGPCNQMKSKLPMSEFFNRIEKIAHRLGLAVR